MENQYEPDYRQDPPRDANADMLNSVKKNAEMGKKSIDSIVKKIENGEFKDLLLAHYEDFEKQSSRNSTELTDIGQTPKSGNIFSDAMLKSSIAMNTLLDDSVSHIADMMIEGSNMGITTINKELNKHRDEVSESTVELANELLTLEQEHIEQLKPYL